LIANVVVVGFGYNTKPALSKFVVDKTEKLYAQL